ncbi:MAG: L-cystine-binding protein TcyK [Treponematales bacterium]
MKNLVRNGGARRAALGTAAVAVIIASLLPVSSCAKKQAAEAGVKQIVVGTGSGYKPYCYLDDDGNLTGYEKAVLDAVDELLPQYAFKYQILSFQDVLLSIDSGKVDIGAHEFEINPDRIQNYLFGEVPYNNFDRYIVVLESSDYGISGIDDLGGKNVFASPGDNATYFFEQWNKEHPDNPMNIQLASGITTEERLAGLRSGKFHAYSGTKHDISDLNAAYPNSKVKAVGEPHIVTNTYFVFRKGNTELQTAVDGALRELIKSGRLERISVKEVGDYSLNYTVE